MSELLEGTASCLYADSRAGTVLGCSGQGTDSDNEIVSQ